MGGSREILTNIKDLFIEEFTNYTDC